MTAKPTAALLRQKDHTMKWIIIAMLTTLIAVSPATAQRQSTPKCSRVVTSGYVHNGQYAGVNCPEGRLLVSMRPGQALPRRGPARIVGQQLYAGGVYSVVQQ
jgi:hypothetical protein